VNTYVQRIYAKLRVRDRVSCVTKALALHYV
jgi:DNA-binding NarL/FixJ family response regulator